jgi:Tfp pilus assembly protein PilN
MRVNLLPTEINERQVVRRQTVVVGVIGLLIVMALGAFFMLQQIRLNAVSDDLAVQEQRNQQLQAEINDLQRFDQLQRQLEEGQVMLAALLADEVHWSGVLRDVSLVIPGSAWLTGLTGDSGATPALPAEGMTGLVGQISFNGNALSHRDVAMWLTRLEDVEGFVNPWLSNSQKTEIGATEVVQFTSTVDLSQDSLARPGGTP